MTWVDLIVALLMAGTAIVGLILTEQSARALVTGRINQSDKREIAANYWLETIQAMIGAATAFVMFGFGLFYWEVI